MKYPNLDQRLFFFCFAGKKIFACFIFSHNGKIYTETISQVAFFCV